MIGFVVFSLRRAWQGFWRNALMSLAATATMVLMLVLLAGFWILQTGPPVGPRLHRAEGRGRRQHQVTRRRPTSTTLRHRIEALPEVAGVTFVTREEALARFQRVA